MVIVEHHGFSWNLELKAGVKCEMLLERRVCRCLLLAKTMNIFLVPTTYLFSNQHPVVLYPGRKLLSSPIEYDVRSYIIRDVVYPKHKGATLPSNAKPLGLRQQHKGSR